jgi:outer membrane protein assembly factor BamB
VTIVGNPRAAALRAPAAQEDAVCGLVDLLDFPLDAPHARNASGGGDDFGIFRNRFDGHHTGEDWWLSGARQSSLGAPVYSVGHGQVTYAEPLGWNRDKGVIIVRHTFIDGRELLSFYGHLDEDSLKVAAGDCVARGDLIGKIGRPTTGPHLHFELRTVMPFAPGRGYLPDDPILAGYLPPSSTIWNSRMAVSPGVLWTQPFAGDGLRSVAALGEEMIMVLEGDHIAGLDMADGSERWRLAAAEDVEQALLDVESRQLYTANQFGEVSAFALPDGENSAEVTGAAPLWMADADVVGIPTLMPLPGGGLILSAWNHLVAISAQGALLWEADLETRPDDWLVSGGTLIGTTNGGERPLWTANANGWRRWDSNVGGRLAAAGNNVLLYDGNTLYRLDLESESVEPMLALPGGRLETGDVAALPGGAAIIAHADRADRRLIALDGTGDLLWERSVADVTAGNLDLLVEGDDLFLIDQYDGGSGSELALFALGLAEAQLTYLFSGGTRSSQVDQTRLFALGNGRILINIDGRSLTVLDTKAAQTHTPFRPVD